MPIEAHGLGEAITALTDDAITIHLHTGNPGTSGTTNRVATSSIGSATIAATSGWTITGGRAVAAANVSFGTANAAVTGVSWISMFKGANFFARRELSSSVNISNGATVELTASSVVIEVTSTDS